MIKSSRAAVIEPVVRLLCKPVVIPTTRNNFQSQLSSQHRGETSPSSCMINKQTKERLCDLCDMIKGPRTVNSL